VGCRHGHQSTTGSHYGGWGATSKDPEIDCCFGLGVPGLLFVIDGLLAASAKVRRWTLVTRDTADLARSGVLLLNPSDPPSPA